MSDSIQPTGTDAPPAAPAVTAPPAAAPAMPAPDAVAQSGDPTRLERLERELAALRTENASRRIANKQLVESLLGDGASTDQPPDPAAVLKQFRTEREEFQKQIRQSKIDLALTDVYAKVGVKARTTRALLETEGLLSSLNPDDAEFQKTLHSSVKKLADENPELKVVQAPTPAPRSSAPFPGGNNNPTPQLTREDLKGMTADEVNSAREKGQLNQLLGRR